MGGMIDRIRVVLVLAWLVIASSAARSQDSIPFVPTPMAVVERMLALAEVKKSDILYDLGSGDGRIVITAAKKFGTRGVGVDVDPARIVEARQNAAKAGVADRVK